MKHRIRISPAILGLTALVMLPTLAVGQNTNPIPGHPWTYIIPDPDKFDWSSNNRPGYHFAGMSPNQKKFYEYIQAKKAAGVQTTATDEMMIRRMTALRAWPEGPKPNEFWKSFMRYMRERKDDELNISQRIMMGQLLSRGISGYDNPGDEGTRKLAEYLKSGPFEARNWFERTFGRVEPWLKYEYQSLGYAPVGGGGGGNVFPPDGHFNGLRITYNVSGASLGPPKDAGGFTNTRTMEGTFKTGGTLTVSGTVQVGGFGADIRVYVFAGSQNKTYETYIENKQGANTGNYSVSVPIPKDATTAGFSVREDGRYSMGGGHRGLIVSASLTLDPTEKAAKAAAADAEWRAHVEETLKMLGYQQTQAGQEVEAMRKALAGGDAAWKKYVDDQQKKLGYDNSPEGQQFANLSKAVDQGGEAFNAYVRNELGDKAPAWAKSALPDLGGIAVGVSSNAGQLSGATDTLTGVSSLSTVYNFTNLPDNTVIEAVWTRDGEEVIKSQRTVSGNGWVSFGITSTAKLKAGRYTVTLQIGGKPIARKTVTVN